MRSEIVLPAPPAASNPAEEEFLTRFERENIPSEYKEHYLANARISTQAFRGSPNYGISTSCSIKSSCASSRTSPRVQT